jgi:hypothetical protein
MFTGIEGKNTMVNKEGNPLGYRKVYYHPDVAANILSFHSMAKRFISITYNNTIHGAAG